MCWNQKEIMIADYRNQSESSLKWTFDLEVASQGHPVWHDALVSCGQLGQGYLYGADLSHVWLKHGTNSWVKVVNCWVCAKDSSALAKEFYLLCTNPLKFFRGRCSRMCNSNVISVEMASKSLTDESLTVVTSEQLMISTCKNLAIDQLIHCPLRDSNRPVSQ